MPTSSYRFVFREITRIWFPIGLHLFIINIVDSNIFFYENEVVERTVNIDGGYSVDIAQWVRRIFYQPYSAYYDMRLQGFPWTRKLLMQTYINGKTRSTNGLNDMYTRNILIGRNYDGWILTFYYGSLVKLFFFYYCWNRMTYQSWTNQFGNNDSLRNQSCKYINENFRYGFPFLQYC